jgi:nicotinate-nucleotide adenylyltransferase
MRIGILGGTFNPVHNGHLHIAKHALKRLRLDRVIFIPTYVSPHKKMSGNAKARDRIAMLRLALRGERRFSVLDYEIRRKGISYSIRTVHFLRRKFGKKAHLFFLLGADSVSGLKAWKKSGELMDLVQFVAFPRPGFSLSLSNPTVIRLRTTKKDVSSSRIRLLVKRGRRFSGLVPTEVQDYIEKKNLYRE